MMYHLDPTKQETAIKLATKLEPELKEINVQV